MGASRHVPSQAVRALASYEMRQPSKRGVPFSFDDAARRRFPSRGGLRARSNPPKCVPVQLETTAPAQLRAEAGVSLVSTTRRFPSRGGLDARGARLAGTTAHRAKLRRVMN